MNEENKIKSSLWILKGYYQSLKYVARVYFGGCFLVFKVELNERDQWKSHRETPSRFYIILLLGAKGQVVATHLFGIYSEMIVSSSTISAVCSKVKGNNADNTRTES